MYSNGIYPEHATEFKSLVCRHCGSLFFGKPSWYVGGLEKYTCTLCGRNVLYPLRKGWLVFWWVLALLTLALTTVLNF